MEKKEKIALLTEWAVAYKNLDVSYDALAAALGCDICESDIFDASYKMFEVYTKAIAVILAGDKDAEDVESWLSWYCYEDGMGEKGMAAKASTWKRFKKIKNLNDLLKVIEE
jgi:hypothetical protein